MSAHFLKYIVTVIGLSAALIIVSAVAASANDNILDSQPIKKFSSHDLPQWQDILKSDKTTIYNSNNSNVQNWTKLIRDLQGQPKLRQLLRVNLWFKQFSYKQDNLIYGEDDYWTTPLEFLTKGGDCEDFAIIKYMTLRQLGVPAKDMKIAIVYDVYSGTDHAFLVVKHDGAEFIMDNREKLVVARYMKTRYKPHYAFNENNAWAYNSPIVAKKMRQHSNREILPGNR